MPDGLPIAAATAAAAAVEHSVGSILARTGDLSRLRTPPDSAAERVVRDAASERAADDEWRQIPRNRFDFAENMALLPKDIEARQFLRHEQLNPRDRWVPRDDRQALDEILRNLGERFAAFEQAQIRGLQADFAAATIAHRQWVAESEASVVHREDGTSVFSWRPDGSHWLVAFEGDRAYTVPTPMSDFAVRHRALLIEEVGSAIVEWFRMHGLCSAGEAEAIVRKLFEVTEAACATHR